jgi:hypothetical protein
MGDTEAIRPDYAAPELFGDGEWEESLPDLVRDRIASDSMENRYGVGAQSFAVKSAFLG